MKETLITASIGIFKLGDTYFLQIITADQYHFYDVQITRHQAITLSRHDNIEIEEVNSLPVGILLGGNIH